MRKINSSFWQDKRVLITGHTGFKGTWLTLLLSKLGSKIFGLALPALDKSLFTQSHAIDLIENRDKHFCDISDFNSVRQLILECKPDIVIHMAAQPLVIKSYQDPRETWQTNVMGTVNVLTSYLKLISSVPLLLLQLTRSIVRILMNLLSQKTQLWWNRSL